MSSVTSLRVVRFEALIVSVVLHVAVGTLNGDVHTLTDGGVREVVGDVVCAVVTGKFAA